MNDLHSEQKAERAGWFFTKQSRCHDGCILLEGLTEPVSFHSFCIRIVTTVVTAINHVRLLVSLVECWDVNFICKRSPLLLLLNV